MVVKTKTEWSGNDRNGSTRIEVIGSHKVYQKILIGIDETEQNDTEKRECLHILLLTPEWEESLL